MATTVVGDLLQSDASIIVHQSNCVTRKPHGISEEIARRWPEANVYVKRQGKTPKHDESIPGTCVILPLHSNETATLYVAALMGQVCPGNGKSPYWSLRYGKDYANDTPVARLRYFKAALEDLAEQLVAINIDALKKTIAFPYCIGCELAGCEWIIYEALIQTFANRVLKTGWKTKIYKM